MSAVLPSDVPARPSPGSLAASHRCGATTGSAAADRARRRTSLQAAAIGAGVLAQGVALAWLGGGGVMAIAVAAVLALASAAAWMHRRQTGRADVVIATLAFGGVGMMAGAWIARTVSTPPMHHAGMAHGTTHGTPTPVSWIVATVVMLVTCAVACRWTCDPLCRGGRMRRTLAHSIAALGMVGGMAAADAVLSPVLVRWIGAAAGMHAAMVLGMAVGAGAALPVVAWVDARASRTPPTPAEGEAGDPSGACPAG